MYRFLVLFFGLLLGGCKENPVPVSETTPSMARETPGKIVSNTEPESIVKSGQGNFESLVAVWEDKDRAIWQKPELVISHLGDLSEKTVADIGAGTGYFTFRLVPKAKKVIGIDIDSRFINFLDSIKVKLPMPLAKRFESRLAKPEDPMLRTGEADVVMIVNTYAYIENRSAYLDLLKKGMSRDGELLIIDFKRNNIPVGPPDEFRVSVTQVETELKKAGFKIEKTDTESLDYQYIVLAQKSE